MDIAAATLARYYSTIATCADREELEALIEDVGEEREIGLFTDLQADAVIATARNALAAIGG